MRQILTLAVEPSDEDWDVLKQYLQPVLAGSLQYKSVVVSNGSSLIFRQDPGYPGPERITVVGFSFGFTEQRAKMSDVVADLLASLPLFDIMDSSWYVDRINRGITVHFWRDGTSVFDELTTDRSVSLKRNMRLALQH
jgi:hypothetical protein